MIAVETFSVTTDGAGAGVATGNVYGYIIAIHTDATDTVAGSDVTWATVANTDRGTVAETVLTLTDLGANAAVDYPRRAVQGTTGADLATAGDAQFGMVLATGQMTMTVAAGGATNVVTGAVWYEDGQ